MNLHGVQPNPPSMEQVPNQKYSAQERENLKIIKIDYFELDISTKIVYL